jgi:hypothetical protein
MRDSRTFLKLQEVIRLKQAAAQGPIAYDAQPLIAFDGVVLNSVRELVGV